MTVETINLLSTDLDRFHRFRISDELLDLHQIRRVTDGEARNNCGIHFKGDLYGVVFPIFGLDQQIKGYRVRRDNPEIESGQPKNKYVQSLDRSRLYFERSSSRWLSDSSVPVIFVEAYTSALAIAAWCKRTGQSLLIVAMGGCWSWRGTIGKTENENGVRVDEKGPLSDLSLIPLEARRVIIMFDTNIASNTSVQAAERNFKLELEKRGAAVETARIPEESGINGPDDFLARHTDDEFLDILNTADVNPWPDPQPVRASLRPVEALPHSLIPEPFQDWLIDISERMGCPLDFVAAASIVVTGSVIGAGCGIRPKRNDDWTVVPNLWGGVVGRPSLMLKTPALQESMRPLERLAAESKADYDAAFKDYDAEVEMFKAKKDAAKELMRAAAKGKKKGDAVIHESVAKTEYSNIEEPTAPIWRRYKTNDATVEKLGEMLSQNPRGMLVYRDELIGLLSQWDREGREGDRAFFLEAWNGTGSHETDRIGRGSIRIENACISILGGIQPAKLASYLYQSMRGNDNDGLFQRLQLLVYPDEPPAAKIVDRYPNTEAKTRAYKIIEKLAHMDFIQAGATVSDDDGIPFFRFDNSAQEMFYAWFDELNDKMRTDDEPIVTEHLGKFRSLMPSLALIFHLIDIAGGASAGPILEISAKRAAAFCEYLESHARRIYSLVLNIHFEAAARLSKKILTGDLGKSFTVRDVYIRDWALLTDKSVVEAACDELVIRGSLRQEQPAITGGRPRSTEYVVNPRLTSVGFVGAHPDHLEVESELAR
jgi:hypothetical protein